MLLSIVIPVYKKQILLPTLYVRLINLVKMINNKFDISGSEIEVVFENDGSRHNSFPILLGLTKDNKIFKVLNLSRNFGLQIAVKAGIDYAHVDAVAYAELQDHPFDSWVVRKFFRTKNWNLKSLSDPTLTNQFDHLSLEFKIAVFFLNGFQQIIYGIILIAVCLYLFSFVLSKSKGLIQPEFLFMIFIISVKVMAWISSVGNLRYK